jgi:hypothetical protein
VAPSRSRALFVSLLVSGVWLGVLALLAYRYLKDMPPIAGIKDEDEGGVLPLAWVGSLGALTANFSDIARRADRWNPHLATWFLVRPLTGAAFGAIGYLIFRAAVQVSVTNTDDLGGPAILGYAIAFTLGYREETFRELLKRITDLLATAGGGDVVPPSAPPGLDCEAGPAADSDVTISWNRRATTSPWPATTCIGTTAFWRRFSSGGQARTSQPPSTRAAMSQVEDGSQNGSASSTALQGIAERLCIP